MAEVFLEEQLRRIREMSEQMSRLRNHAVEIGQPSVPSRSLDEQGHADTGEPLRPRRHTARVTSRRRAR
jgi:hypothetical protein